MTTPEAGAALVLLVRHGRSTANAGGVLAGRTAGIGLDDTGRHQAEGLIRRLDGYPVTRIVSSPLERCRQTVAPLAQARGLTVEVDPRLAEVDYGDWSGKALSDLRGDPLWATVQQHPTGMTFPQGEALRHAAARAVDAAREYGANAAPSDAVVLCSHGDLISAILADALGMHLDMFQRLVVGPSSVSAVRYLPGRPVVEYVNDADRTVPGAGAAAETVGGDPGAAMSSAPASGPVA